MNTYFIACHKNEEFVRYLIESLYRENDLFIINCDLKSPAALLTTVQGLAENYSNIELLDRRWYSWAGFSQVRTTMRAISKALELSADWSHFIPLSEQHLPTVSPASLDELLKDKGSLVGVNRVTEMRLSERLDVELRLALRYEELPGVGAFSAGMLAPDTDLIEGLFHGSNWYILSRKHCETLCTPRMVERFEKFANSIHGDESVVQSLIWSPEAQEVDSVENVVTTFVAWPHLTDNPHMIFNEENYWSACDAGIPFVRKRPSVLPKSIENHLKSNHDVQLDIASDTQHYFPLRNGFLDRDVEDLKSKIVAAVHLLDKELKVDFRDDCQDIPYFYIKIFGAKLRDLSVHILSEDMENFKLILSQEHCFDGFFLPYRERGREVSLVRARVHGLFLTKDISVPNAENFGFIKMESKEYFEKEIMQQLRVYIYSAEGFNYSRE
ncbi:beta-1,6-N-acetylglucosaminyltransferase [Methylosinus sporium]|uniref:beta-1,6-N-acetylglucosaminyltransferase n=1 Tax=Methylosinus sporium TaxID=428 RepID=UPI00383B7790